MLCARSIRNYSLFVTRVSGEAFNPDYFIRATALVEWWDFACLVNCVRPDKRVKALWINWLDLLTRHVFFGRASLFSDVLLNSLNIH